MVYGGRGMGRMEGKVVFLPFVVPGEEVECALVKEKNNWAEARLLKVLQPSSHRRRPVCRYFQSCGGCHYQHIIYNLQLQYKAAIFKSIMTRHGKVPESVVAPIEALGKEFGWRARARLSASDSGGEGFGFFQAGSHRISMISSCPVVDEELEAMLPLPVDLVRQAIRLGIGSCTLETGLNGAKRIVFHVNSITKRIKKLLSKFSVTCDISVSLRDKKGCISSLDILQPLCVYRGELAPEGLYVPPGSFFQANLLGNGELIARVVEYCRIAGGNKIWEFFSGCGNFSIPLAVSGFRVTAIESDRCATGEALVNRERNSAWISGLHFVNADADSFIRAQPRTEWPDTIVLDPPRTGAAQLCMAIAENPVSTVIYVSCDPMTLARDIRILSDAGLQVIKSVPIDMFPQTGHIESVTLLQA